MEGLIRKIIIGKDPKDGMAYYVGMRAGKGTVSAIIEDERHLHKFGLRDTSCTSKPKKKQCCGRL